MTDVVMDRTASSVPLPKGGLSPESDGFGIFERNILRLGYYTSRESGDDALHGELLVVLHPDREATPANRDALESYVRRGGKLLVSRFTENKKSTPNSLLIHSTWPMDHATGYTGNLAASGGLPAMPFLGLLGDRRRSAGQVRRGAARPRRPCRDRGNGADLVQPRHGDGRRFRTASRISTWA